MSDHKANYFHKRFSIAHHGFDQNASTTVQRVINRCGRNAPVWSIIFLAFARTRIAQCRVTALGYSVAERGGNHSVPCALN
jgi:hypothetical protein